MNSKKPTMPADSDKSPEELELEARIDAMMDLGSKDTAPTSSPESADNSKPLDIFEGQKTAPELETVSEEKDSEDKQEDEKPADDEAEQSEETPEADDDTPDTSVDTPSDDAETSKAVDDITRAESDALLKAEDDKVKAAAAPKPKSRWQKVKGFFRAWWGNKWARWATISALVVLLVGSAVWPTSRYFLMNLVGVRSSASLRVLDASTGLPLKNVEVNLGGAAALSDIDGDVTLYQVKLGKQELQIERVAFATDTQTITVGWGSNPLGEYELEATGAQYVFAATDFLSDKPVTNAEATSGRASAIADNKGIITLTVDDPGTDTLTVAVTADQYRTEELTFDVKRQGRINVNMVPATPVVFISKQSGTYDLHRVDADGKNPKLLVKNIARDSLQSKHAMNLQTSPDGKMAAVVSKREERRDQNGYLLDTLSIVNLETGDAEAIDYGQQLRVLGWSGKRVVYVATYAGPSAATDGRQRVISYDTAESSRSMIAKADYFKGLMFIRGQLYYSVYGSVDGTPRVVRINADGSGEKILLKEKFWSIMRVSASELALESENGVKYFSLEDGDVEDGERRDARYYVDGASGRSLWVDERDGKGVLLHHDAKSNEDGVLATTAGLSPPVSWLNDTTALYAVITQEETALYAVSTEGGKPVKVTDATIPSVMIYGY